MRMSLCLCLGLFSLLTACGQRESPPAAALPGSDKEAKTAMLETGAALLQRKPPLGALDTYLDGFHFYSGDMAQQMEAHHYCSILNEELIQCVIFDGSAADARLMGVEYIVSARLFATLPADEKALWHSHAHEVRSGQLIAPGVPEIAEKELMTKIASTYGKTWHMWHTHRADALPLGIPALMMGFTQDGQANSQMVADRDRRLDVSSSDKRARRSDIPYPVVDPAADAWQRGPAIQLQVAPR